MLSFPLGSEVASSFFEVTSLLILGKKISRVALFPGSLWTIIATPWLFTVPRTTMSPIPVPSTSKWIKNPETFAERAEECQVSFIIPKGIDEDRRMLIKVFREKVFKIRNGSKY